MDCGIDQNFHCCQLTISTKYQVLTLRTCPFRGGGGGGSYLASQYPLDMSVTVGFLNGLYMFIVYAHNVFSVSELSWQIW